MIKNNLNYKNRLHFEAPSIDHEVEELEFLVNVPIIFL